MSRKPYVISSAEFLRYLGMNKYYPIDQIASDLYISKTSVYRMIAKLKYDLSYYPLTVVNRHFGIVIEYSGR